jgi:predicted phage terminase large subunit-like protein
MSRAREWLAPFRLQGEVHWDEKNKTWTFPSGATLSFGYLEHANDKYRYQGAAFHFIGFDELTQIDEDSYIYLFSRNRRLASSQIPLRLRAASNPGGEGHEWVKQRFLVEGEKEGRVFIPAMLDDNPYLDRVEYIRKLMKLDPVTRAQLLEGNWEVRHGGSMFSRKWFPRVKMQDVPEHVRLFRFWDLAASEVKPGKKPAFTCGLLLGEKKGFYWIINVQRARKTPFEVERMIQRAAEFDKYGVTIGMEQEPGSAGINVIDHYARVVLKGYTFKGIRATGSKTDRAKPASASAEQGYISVVEAPWNSEFFDELEVFPDSTYRDQADSLSGAHQMASRHVNYDAIPISVGVGPSYWGRNFSSMN